MSCDDATYIYAHDKTKENRGLLYSATRIVCNLYVVATTTTTTKTTAVVGVPDCGVGGGRGVGGGGDGGVVVGQN